VWFIGVEEAFHSNYFYVYIIYLCIYIYYIGLTHFLMNLLEGESRRYS